MSNIQNIEQQRRLDHADIAAAIAAPETISLVLVNSYASGLDPDAGVNINEMDAPTLAAFKTLQDFITWQFEANCPIFKITFDASLKFFKINYYLRDAVSTAAPATLPNGTELGVRFEFAGFDVNTHVDVTAKMKLQFDSGDVAALNAAGIMISGTGDQFSISTTRECRVGFFKPAAITGQYVIVYYDALTVIPAG